MTLEDHKDVKMTIEGYANTSEKGSYLGKLLFPPTSKYKLERSERGITITIVTSSPLQSHTPLYEVMAVVDDTGQVLSQTGFYELSELENWINWILRKSG